MNWHELEQSLRFQTKHSSFLLLGGSVTLAVRIRWTHLYRNCTYSLLSCFRVAIHHSIATVTVHCAFDRHAKRLEEKENAFLFMCQLQALARKRRRFIASFLLNFLTELFGIKVAALAKFILDSIWFSIANVYEYGITMDLS